MFRRRLAVLGTAAMLALTGLGGSAMADDAPTDAASSTASGTVSCRTSDGKDIKFAEGMKGRVFVTKDGEVHKEGDASAMPVPPLPEGEAGPVLKTAPGLPSSPAETFAPTETVEAVPALPATEAPEGGDPATTVKILCVAEKPAE